MAQPRPIFYCTNVDLRRDTRPPFRLAILDDAMSQSELSTIISCLKFPVRPLIFAPGSSAPGVNFIKVERIAQIIEIALSKLYPFAPYAYDQLLHYKKLLKSWVPRFALCAQLYEIDPRCPIGTALPKSSVWLE